MKKILQIFAMGLMLITNCYSQWVQQNIPLTFAVNDLQFINGNTGWMTLSGPGALLKTENGGMNWSILKIGTNQYARTKFFSETFGYAFGILQGFSSISKSANGGTDWQIIYSTPNIFSDESFISPDTGWVCGFAGNFGRIWRTTNTCQSFQEVFSGGSTQMDKIFFLKQKVNGEYTGWCSQGEILRKTTNSGMNWGQVSMVSASNRIFFINKDTGWICNGAMFKSTNGGADWVNEPMPSGQGFASSAITSFVYAGNNILYGIGGTKSFADSQSERGVIWKTTNAGLNWGYQQPDTSFSIPVYGVIYFINPSEGWAYNLSGNKGIHTTNGGGELILGIKTISSSTPKDFKLYQNFPNPFNPSTSIKYQIAKNSYVTVKIYDDLGREVYTLVNQRQAPGSYEADFSANSISSGIFFYRLTADGKMMDTKKMVLVK